MKSALKRALNGMCDMIAPAPRVQLTDLVREQLMLTPLTVVDVGAVFGPDKRWSQLGERTCRFITFEPDERSHTEPVEAGPFTMLALATAIGRAPGLQTLHLTQGEFASSLYLPNEAVLRVFATWPWHESAGSAQVAVDTLDQALAPFAEWQADFIKTDIEGADLDALLGGEKTVASALGLQVEAAFVERNVGAPLFADIDQHLRTRGFVLFQLIREHWLRSNLVRGVTSRPQLIWADVIYFRGSEDFAGRLAAAPDKASMLTKFVALLLVHGHFDTATDVVAQALLANHCSPALAVALTESIRRSTQAPLFVMRSRLAVLLAWAVRLIAMPLGAAAREQARQIYTRKAAPLFHHLYRESMSTGLGRGCLSDLP